MFSQTNYFVSQIISSDELKQGESILVRQMICLQFYRYRTVFMNFLNFIFLLIFAFERSFGSSLHGRKSDNYVFSDESSFFCMCCHVP